MGPRKIGLTPPPPPPTFHLITFYWPSQSGTSVAVSFVLCSVMFNVFEMLKLNASVGPIYLVQLK